MSQVKVVDINIAQHKAPSLPPVLHAVRHTAKTQLAALIQSLFDNTDDALFELADKSQSDRQQEMYFDSMRHVRLHRKTIAERFIKNFMASWPALLENKDQLAQQKNNADDEPENEYALVEQDDLEMTVAIAGIVSKVTSLHSLAIMQLTKRLGAVVAPHVVTERSNPLGPHALSTDFSDALDTLDVNIKVHIIIMKLFERFVMERMGPVYEHVNKQLIQAGVLPDLKNRPSSTRTSRSPVTSPSSAPEPTPASGHGGNLDGASTTEFGFSTVQSLLAGVRSGGAGIGGVAGMGGSPASGAGSAGGAVAGNGPGSAMGGGSAAGGNTVVLPMDELMSVLNKVQQEVGSAEINVSEVPAPADVYKLVQSAGGGKARSLGQAEDDTVNFVGLLFDYILNDRNLAIPMKALIGRLQIPIVKLALIDKSFFSKSSHPARALLNDLSSAGIGWSSAKELKRDSLYNKIESVVHSILNDFEENPDLFSELLADFRAFANKDSRRNLLVEQRVKDTEHGKARTQEAKLAVQKVINQKASGLRLPQEVGRFISEIWSRALTLRYVKYGIQSPHWTAGVSTLDDLLWVLQPLCELEEVERRDELVPTMLEQIRDGMNDLGCPGEEITHFCDWLENHLQLLADNDRAYLDVDEREELPTPTAIVEDIVLSTIEEVSDADLHPDTVNELKALTEGAWVELSEGDGAPIRCKLATVTQPGHNYVFVNKRGMKVAEKNRLQLAGLLEKDCLRLIDESQVFDRALQSVISNLRDMQRNRPRNG